MFKVNKLFTRNVLVLSFFLTVGFAYAFPAAASLSVEEAGMQTAADMNRRFLDTHDTCGANPAWFCNGIMIRAANATPSYHAWDPSPSSQRRGGVSFSYFRSDLYSTRLQGARTQGFTIKSGQAGELSVNPLKVLCSFPYDAGTGDRGDNGCGGNKYYSLESKACSALGITTAKQWLAHFSDSQLTGEEPYRHQCGFAADAAESFATSLVARRISKPQEQLVGWSQNELSIATWKSGIAEQLPLESFFYIPQPKTVSSAAPAGTDLSGLAGAQFMQRDYYQQTGMIIPVIRMSLSNQPQDVFSWRAEDQAISTGKIVGLLPDIADIAGEKSKTITKAYYYRLPYLTVSVPHYAGMATGDVVSIRWTGPNHTYISEEKTIATPGVITFQIPRVEVIDSIGHTAQISFAAKQANGIVERSSALPVQVEGQELDLPPPVISSDLHEVKVKFNGMNASHRISVRLEGVKTHDTSRQPGSFSEELFFDIPEGWVQENHGKTILINYAVGDEWGGKFQFSRTLRFDIP
ncbi:hypothetical protein D781_3827 [Serratia sp. FGI94]|uniref:hypothetical protein n=1 Tax=Serratia sp. FGI94 TaxID=671990 RepID=UPI0002A71A76|nr:hypothetical protein [Serratia sp. FGI94]AGB84021.1 hypothetical protein D781_3827 [Serratia sp. FGI94]